MFTFILATGQSTHGLGLPLLLGDNGDGLVKRLHKPTGIVIHHSATRDTSSVSFAAIRDYHIHEKHWEDIGYHILIEDTEEGVEIFTGRGLQFEGAHAVGKNDKIGVCVVGNFDEDFISTEKYQKLLSVIRGLLMMYDNINWEGVEYHNESSEKSCPGKLFPPKSTLLSDLYVYPE